MSNRRKDRWDDRANLKLASNRKNNLDATHPQARRQLESGQDQLTEPTPPTINQEDE